MPSAKTIVELRAQATLATRPPKEMRSLADRTAGWRQRVAQRLGSEPTGWSQSVIGQEGEFLTTQDVPLAAIEAIGAEVIAAVSVKRAVWTHWNLMAEAAKQTMDLRFATTEDREAIVGLIVDAAQARSVVLTPPELALSPPGSSARAARAGSARGTVRSTPRSQCSTPRRDCRRAPRR